MTHPNLIGLTRLSPFVTELVLNRPLKRNALTLPMARQIVDSCSRISKDRELRAVILRGEGRMFCSGRDLTASLTHSAAEADEYLEAAIASVRAVYDLHVPTIGVLHGAALGYGLELALACDIRIVSKDCRLALPETSLGIFPGAGGSYLLPAILGNTSMAMDWILTGRDIQVEEALRVGLVSQVSDDPFKSGQDLADRIASNGPLGVQEAKRSIKLGLEDKVFGSDIAQETLAARKVLTHTQDHKEALLAFKEKRKPVFHGR